MWFQLLIAIAKDKPQITNGNLREKSRLDVSKRPQNLFEFLTRRRAHQGLKIAIGVLVKGRWCGRKPELLHQVLIGLKLAADIDGNLRQGFNAAAAVLLLMQRQGCLRVWCRQERRSFARAGWPQDAHDDMPHLNLACFYPRLRFVPKLVAVGGSWDR